MLIVGNQYATRNGRPCTVVAKRDAKFVVEFTDGSQELYREDGAWLYGDNANDILLKAADGKLVCVWNNGDEYVKMRQLCGLTREGRVTTWRDSNYEDVDTWDNFNCDLKQGNVILARNKPTENWVTVQYGWLVTGSDHEIITVSGKRYEQFKFR